MTDRSGCGLVEVTVLQSLEAVTAGRRGAHVKSARAVAGIEARIGLGPRFAYQILVALTQKWTVAVPLVSGRGNFGDRAFAEPAADRYTESRPSRVGQLVLDAETHRLPPVPVGLINGTTWWGGTRPALEPFRLTAALRKLLDDPQISDQDLLAIVGPPHSVTGCDINGDLKALYRGQRTEIRETARITVTGIPVPDPPQEPQRTQTGHSRTLSRLSAGGSRPRFAPHLVIESLPAQITSSDAMQAIASRIQARPWHDAHPELADDTSLPIADIDDEWPENDVKINVRLRPGSDAAAVRDQLLSLDGIGWGAIWAFPAPLGSMFRTWVQQQQDEDLATSLSRLENAIRQDQHR